MKSLPRLHLLVAALSICALAMTGPLPGSASTNTTGNAAGNNVARPLVVPRPSNLRQPANSADCVSHVYNGGAGYYEHIAYGCSHPTANYTFLVWDYSGARPHDGYHVYRTDSGRQDYGIHNDGTVAQIYYAGGRACFVVTAVNGTTESPDSNQFCIYPVAAPMHVMPH